MPQATASRDDTKNEKLHRRLSFLKTIVAVSITMSSRCHLRHHFENLCRCSLIQHARDWYQRGADIAGPGTHGPHWHPYRRRQLTYLPTSFGIKGDFSDGSTGGRVLIHPMKTATTFMHNERYPSFGGNHGYGEWQNTHAQSSSAARAGGGCGSGERDGRQPLAAAAIRPQRRVRQYSACAGLRPVPVPGDG